MVRYQPAQLGNALGAVVTAYLRNDVQALHQATTEFHTHWSSDECQYFVQSWGTLLATEQNGRHFLGGKYRHPSFETLFASARLVDMWGQLPRSIQAQRDQIGEAAMKAKTAFDLCSLVADGGFDDATRQLAA